MTCKRKIPPKLLLVTVLLFFQQLVFADANQSYRSLSKIEQQAACQVLISQVMPRNSVSCGVSSFSPISLVEDDNRHLSESNNTELLLIERFEQDKSSQARHAERVADVYSYNYQNDTLNYSVINLTTGQVISSEDKQGVQLPLTGREVVRSLTIASGDQEAYGLIEAEFLKITGTPLLSLDQLEVKAFIFLAKSMPGQVNEKTKACGIHRCARLVIHTSDRIALDTAPIIDLSDGIVSQQRVGLL